MREDTRQCPLERNICCLYTLYSESFKMWKVTVVWIECNDAIFNAISRRSTQQIVLLRKNLNSVSKVATACTRYSVVFY